VRLPTPEAFTLGSLRGPLVWGVVLGGVQAASPLAFFWLAPTTVTRMGSP